MTFAPDCQLDPGCQIGNDSENILRIPFVRGLGTTTVAPCTFFLVKEVAGSQGQFKRVGIGSGPIDGL